MDKRAGMGVAVLALEHNRTLRWRQWKLTCPSAQPGAMCADERWSHLVEYSLGRIPSLITDADLTVLCCVKRKGCVVRLEKRRA